MYLGGFSLKEHIDNILSFKKINTLAKFYLNKPCNGKLASLPQQKEDSWAHQTKLALSRPLPLIACMALVLLIHLGLGP